MRNIFLFLLILSGAGCRVSNALPKMDFRDPVVATRDVTSAFSHLVGTKYASLEGVTIEFTGDHAVRFSKLNTSVSYTDPKGLTVSTCPMSGAGSYKIQKLVQEKEEYRIEIFSRSNSLTYEPYDQTAPKALQLCKKKIPSPNSFELSLSKVEKDYFVLAGHPAWISFGNSETSATARYKNSFFLNTSLPEVDITTDFLAFMTDSYRRGELESLIISENGNLMLKTSDTLTANEDYNLKANIEKVTLSYSRFKGSKIASPGVVRLYIREVSFLKGNWKSVDDHRLLLIRNGQNNALLPVTFSNLFIHSDNSDSSGHFFSGIRGKKRHMELFWKPL